MVEFLHPWIGHCGIVFIALALFWSVSVLWYRFVLACVRTRYLLLMTYRYWHPLHKFKTTKSQWVYQSLRTFWNCFSGKWAIRNTQHCVIDGVFYKCGTWGTPIVVVSTDPVTVESPRSTMSEFDD